MRIVIVIATGILSFGTPLVASAAPKAASVRAAAANAGIATQQGVLENTDTALPLPREIQITRTPNLFPNGVLSFDYRVGGGGRNGPVRLELALSADDRRRRTVAVVENVPLVRIGTFEIPMALNDLGRVSCKRRCSLLLTVARGAERRQVQMPLVPEAFARVESRGQTRRQGPAGSLDDFAVSFASGSGIRVGRPIAIVAAIRPLAGRPEDQALGDVRVELVFRDRSGERVVDVQPAARVVGESRVRLAPAGFVVPETGGSFEVRVTKGRSAITARGELTESSWRVGASSRVNDERS